MITSFIIAVIRVLEERMLRAEICLAELERFRLLNPGAVRQFVRLKRPLRGSLGLPRRDVPLPDDLLEITDKPDESW